MLLSFILPCHNTAPFVVECLDSLYSQGLKNDDFEIICINDCSPDNVMSIIEDYQSLHSNIVLVNHEINKGSGGAYNSGLKKATGKYIWFVDSDDYLKKDTAKYLVDLMEKDELEVLQFNIQPFENETGDFINDDNYCLNGNIPYNSKVLTGADFFQLISDRPFNLMPVPAYRKIFKRNFLIENSLFFTETTLGTDLLFTLQVLSIVKRMRVLSDKLYFFRQNPYGVTKSKKTITKLISETNNTAKAYHIIKDSLFPNQIKEYILPTLSFNLSCSVKSLWYYKLKDKKYFYENLYDKDKVRLCLCGFSVILDYPNLYLFCSLFLNPAFCNILRNLKHRFINVYS